MAELRVRADRCVGCGLCRKACPSGAIGIEDSIAVVDKDRCVLCGLCIGACGFDALLIEKETAAAVDIGQYRDVWVFAEEAQGDILPVAFELLGKGRELADARQSRLVAMLFGPAATGENAQRLIACGADKVWLCDEEPVRQKLEDPYTDLVASLVQSKRPEILLFGATEFGRSLAPRVAARVCTGLTADCTVLEIGATSGRLKQTRPAFGGNLMATIVCKHHRPQMATVRPGVFAAPAPVPGRTGRVERVKAPAYSGRVQLLSTQQVHPGESIADAEVIVAAGRGIGSSKNLALVRRLAERLGGAVGVSRPLVDAGWCDYRHQIGQTGLAVAPKLLICCGISGAIQHLAGIGGAQTIVAINTDPDVPIFSVANYKIVGDCVEILKDLLAILEKDRT